jgi:hypothetical protein
MDETTPIPVIQMRSNIINTSLHIKSPQPPFSKGGRGGII